MNGNRIPSCGLMVSSPISTPATTGLRSSSAKIAIIIAVVRNALWPEIRQNKAAGDSSDRNRNPPVGDMPASDRDEHRNAHQRPACQRGKVIQLPERCGEPHHARRIRPVLAGKLHAEEIADRLVIGREIVEPPGIG